MRCCCRPAVRGAGALLLLLAAGQAVRAACPALSVDFFPADTTNVPEGWTKAAQVAAGNEDSSSLNTITLAPKPTPKLYVQPVHPLFTKRTCVPADCLPAKGGRRLSAAGDSSRGPLQELGVGFAAADGGAAAVPLQQLALGFAADGGGGGARQLAGTCLTTVAAPAAYSISYNIDGGVTKKATMPEDGAPFVALNTLDTLAPGKHTLNIMVTMLKGTAEVNSVATLQPETDQEFSTKVAFNLVDELPAGGGKPAAAAPAGKPGDKPPAGKPGGDKPGGGDKPAAAEPAAAKPGKDATAALADNPQPEPAIDAAVTQQAVKYYCMRQYNVGGKIHSEKQVAVGDEGVMQCSVACNALGSNCAGFGLTGKKCFLMKQFNTNSSAPDATLDALCMKSANDWLDFGTRHASQVGAGFFCLRGYDLKGDPAGSGDAENIVQAANTEVAGSTPSMCATTCKGTPGCQYLLMKKPAAAGGTATCFLKMHALGGLYGTTGPSTEIDYTCFNGQDAWMGFASQLDYALPSPFVNTGVETPGVAAITPVGPNGTASAQTYRCIKQYTINGTAIKAVAVSMGDEGLTQCAGKCDDEKGACVAYVMSEAGQCTLLKSINFNTSAPDPRSYGLCFASPLDWNKFGNPDASGMYCIKKYDFAGDGVRTVDYITITTGAAAVQFCKQQCAAEPQCQYVVTSLGKCYMKNNILSGSFGTTRPDNGVDASCVKGEANWALASLQVAAAPPMPMGAIGSANLTARRAAAGSGAGAARAPAPWPALLAGGALAAWAARGGGSRGSWWWS